MTGTTDLDDLRAQHIALELSALAHPVDAPPSHVDIPAAVQVGRRLRQRRRRVRIGAMAVALAAVTVGTLLAAPRHDSTADPAGKGHGRSRWHLTGGVDSHDPLLSTAQFGWLPPGVTASGYTYDHRWADARASGPAQPATKRPTASLMLYVYPRGVDPAVHGARDPRKYAVPAPNVNGRRAYWVTTDPNWPVSPDSELRWQAADGRWVELVALYLPLAGQQRTLLRIAASATVANRSVPLPMSVTGLPVGAVLDESYAWDAPAELSLSEPNWSATIVWELHGYYFGLTVEPHSLAVQARQRPPHGVNHAQNPYETKACVTSNGLDACLDHVGRDAPPAALAALGGLQGLLRHVKVYGLNPEHWTTRVLP